MAKKKRKISDAVPEEGNEDRGDDRNRKEATALVTYGKGKPQ